MIQRRVRSEAIAGLVLELERMDKLLRTRAEELYQAAPPDDGDLHGVFVSDAEFENLIATAWGDSPFSGARPAVAQAVPASRWSVLTEAFGLSAAEAELLLLALLPELDLRYERILAYLQDDVTQKRPSVDLALKLLYPEIGERLGARAMLAPEGVLCACGLLELVPPADGPAYLLAHTLAVSPRIADFLLTPTGMAPAPNFELLSVEACSAALPLAPETTAALDCLSLLPSLDHHWICGYGPDLGSVQGAAREICAKRGLALLRCTPGADLAPVDDVTYARHARREAILQQAALLVSLDAKGGHERRAVVWRQVLAGHRLPVFWATPSLENAHVLQIPQAHLVLVPFPRPDLDRRQALWQQALQGQPGLDAAHLVAVAARYRLNTEQIHRAGRTAAQIAYQRDPLHPSIHYEDLAQAARLVSSARLGQLARQIHPKHTWDDLILPMDRVAQLHELCDRYAFRHQVYKVWGFGAKLSRGRGLSALFVGASGTGKTMAAEIIAQELGLDLFRIDLSGVVSKYIGETEKNLDHIFGLAQDTNAILLFDEADALFGKRSETKDAHDRYANIEISYLLQKIEEYDGVVMLTSNLRQNLDEAFLRRLQYTVEFPFPDAADRIRIWRRMLPDKTPVASNVDLAELGRQFRLSGGSIQNAWLNAAFLAARDGGVIGTEHLRWAVRREFQKMGKLVDDDQFGPGPQEVPLQAAPVDTPRQKGVS